MKNEKNILCSLDYYSVSLKFVQPKHLTFSFGFGNKYILLLNILIAKKTTRLSLCFKKHPDFGPTNLCLRVV